MKYYVCRSLPGCVHGIFLRSRLVTVVLQVGNVTVAFGPKIPDQNASLWLTAVPWGTSPSSAWHLYDRGVPVPIWELMDEYRDPYLGGWIVQILQDAYAHLLHRANKEVLHNLAIAGNRSTVQYLVSTGIGIHVKDSDGNTPLLAAVENGNLETAKQLLQSGARLTDTSQGGSPLLHVAAARGYADMCELLLWAGADLMEKDSAGETAMQIARRSPDKQVFDLLHEHARRYKHEL